MLPGCEVKMKPGCEVKMKPGCEVKMKSLHRGVLGSRYVIFENLIMFKPIYTVSAHTDTGDHDATLSQLRLILTYCLQQRLISAEIDLATPAMPLSLWLERDGLAADSNNIGFKFSGALGQISLEWHVARGECVQFGCTL